MENLTMAQSAAQPYFRVGLVSVYILALTVMAIVKVPMETMAFVVATVGPLVAGYMVIKGKGN